VDVEKTTWTEQALDGLRHAGLRKGGARAAVVEHLGKQSCCLSAQEIFDGIRADGGSAGIASVYRVVDQLADLRLVQRVDIGDGIARYQPAYTGGDHHHHLVCDACGRVEAFSDPALERALARVADSRGYHMRVHEVVVHGACTSCQGGAGHR
jgi:Fur family ferric uptake transcriptional regulator